MNYRIARESYDKLDKLCLCTRHKMPETVNRITANFDWNLYVDLIRITKPETLENKHIIPLKIKIVFLEGSKTQRIVVFRWSFFWTRPCPVALNLLLISMKSNTRFFVCGTLAKLSMRTTFWFLSFESWIFLMKVVRNGIQEPKFCLISEYRPIYEGQWIPGQRFRNICCNSQCYWVTNMKLGFLQSIFVKKLSMDNFTVSLRRHFCDSSFARKLSRHDAQSMESVVQVACAPAS